MLMQYNYNTITIRLQCNYDTITIQVQYQHNAGQAVGNRERSLAHRDGIVRIRLATVPRIWLVVSCGHADVRTRYVQHPWGLESA